MNSDLNDHKLKDNTGKRKGPRNTTVPEALSSFWRLIEDHFRKS